MATLTSVAWEHGRDTGVNGLSTVPWGTHFFLFYETKQDLLESLTSYFKAGLENDEYCSCAVVKPLTMREVRSALSNSIPDFDRFESTRSIEVVPGREFRFGANLDTMSRVLRIWQGKEQCALADGRRGLRVNGNGAWTGGKEMQAIRAYNTAVSRTMAAGRINILCACPLAKRASFDVLDVLGPRHFAVTHRKGVWRLLGSSEATQLDTGSRQLDAIPRPTETRRLFQAKPERFRSLTDDLRLVADTIPQQIWSCQPDGVVDYTNARWRSYTGAGHEMLQADGWKGLLHPEDRERVRNAWKQSVEDGTPFEQEGRHRGMDGNYRWFLSRAIPLRDSAGRILRWYGTNTDVEDRKRTEEELRKQKEILQKIFEHIPVMIASFTDAAVLQLVNPEWERKMGWTMEEIRRRKVDVLREAFPDRRYRKMVMDMLAAGSGQWKDLKLKVRDGRVLDISGAAIRLSDGTTMAIGRDITAQKRTEEALREVQINLLRVARIMAMGELAAAIAHEVNQPLAAIVTNADFSLRELAARHPNLESLGEAIREVVEDGRRAGAIISRIRALFQKGKPTRIELNLNHVILEVAGLLRDELLRHRIAIKADLSVGLPLVKADEVQIQQVLINLIMNAIDAMRSLTSRPRELVIASMAPGSEVRVEVRDSGDGFNPADTDRIFEPFFSTKAEGTGIGLAISRSIVESHGGRLWATQENPGGAVFCFTLPRAGEGA